MMASRIIPELYIFAGDGGSNKQQYHDGVKDDGRSEEHDASAWIFPGKAFIVGFGHGIVVLTGGVD